MLDWKKNIEVGRKETQQTQQRGALLGLASTGKISWVGHLAYYILWAPM